MQDGGGAQRRRAEETAKETAEETRYGKTGTRALESASFICPWASNALRWTLLRGRPDKRMPDETTMTSGRS
jgi:hypothetical protein